MDERYFQEMIERLDKIIEKLDEIQNQGKIKSPADIVFRPKPVEPNYAGINLPEQSKGKKIRRIRNA